MSDPSRWFDPLCVVKWNRSFRKGGCRWKKIRLSHYEFLEITENGFSQSPFAYTALQRRSAVWLLGCCQIFPNKYLFLRKAMLILEIFQKLWVKLQTKLSEKLEGSIHNITIFFNILNIPWTFVCNQNMIWQRSNARTASCLSTAVSTPSFKRTLLCSKFEFTFSWISVSEFSKYSDYRPFHWLWFFYIPRAPWIKIFRLWLSQKPRYRWIYYFFVSKDEPWQGFFKVKII